MGTGCRTLVAVRQQSRHVCVCVSVQSPVRVPQESVSLVLIQETQEPPAPSVFSCVESHLSLLRPFSWPFFILPCSRSEGAVLACRRGCLVLRLAYSVQLGPPFLLVTPFSMCHRYLVLFFRDNRVHAVVLLAIFFTFALLPRGTGRCT